MAAGGGELVALRSLLLKGLHCLDSLYGFLVTKIYSSSQLLCMFDQSQNFIRLKLKIKRGRGPSTIASVFIQANNFFPAPS